MMMMMMMMTMIIIIIIIIIVCTYWEGSCPSNKETPPVPQDQGMAPVLGECR